MSGAIAAAGMGRLARWLDRLQHLGWRGLVRWGEPHRGSGRHVGGNVHTDACASPACPCYQEGRAER